MDENSSSNRNVQQRWANALMATYPAPELTLVRGEGARVWDADGNVYVDFLAGVAVNSLGHAHPAIVEAVTKQVNAISHVSNYYANEPNVQLAERLIGLLGQDEQQRSSGRVFFCNSGAEANEAAFKLARRTGRPNFVSNTNAFHGRTMATLALTGQPTKQTGFAPLPGPVTYVPFGDVDALAEAIDEYTAAVFVEPIQGEGGVVPAPDGYLQAARALTAEQGALLIVDEVQTGIGRTGQWFIHPQLDVRPDVVTLAKGLGGGLPIGACVAFGDAAQLLSKGQHGSTFGGNPIASAAALAVLDTIERDGLLVNVRERGEQLINEIRSWSHPEIAEVRGQGLMLGIRFHEEIAAAVTQSAQRHGFLLNAVAPDVIRLVPPLIIEERDVKALLDALPDCIVESGAHA